MRHRVFVTGANKGIGLAIVKSLLESAVFYVFLGSRDITRGQDAVKALISDNANFAGRVEAVQIDVTDDDSVSRAADAVRQRCFEHDEDIEGSADDTPEAPLTALINNAGIVYPDFSPSQFEKVFDVNVRGAIRTTSAFLPLLNPKKGRVVFVSSTSGPMFAARNSARMKSLVTDPNVTLSQITDLMDEALAIALGGSKDDRDNEVDDVARKFEEVGLKGAEIRSGYGLTKALLGMFTLLVAREHPNLIVNACCPGVIKTDLARVFAVSFGVKDLPWKETSEGAKTPVFLAIGDVTGSGQFFSSDAVRSTFDTPRMPDSRSGPD